MAGDDQRPVPGSNAGSNPGWDRDRDSDNEITIPNIFGGAPRDDDPAAILPGLSAQGTPPPAAWERVRVFQTE